MSTCNCCAAPPCSAPTLEFISVSDACDTPVCGLINPDDDLRYLVKVHTHLDGHTTTYDYTPDPETGDCGTSVVCAGSVTTTTARSFGTGGGDSGSYSFTSTTTYSNDCSTTTVETGSSASTIHYGDGTCISSCSSNFANGTWTGSVTFGGGICGGNTTNEHNYPCIPSSGSTVTVAPAPLETENDEYSSLEDITPCALTFPAYPAWTQPGDDPAELTRGQGRDAVASRDYAKDDVHKAETKVKWRARHSPTGTCYLKAWLRKTTTVTGDPNADPPVEDTVTTDDSTTYEWEGTGNPCIENPDDGFGSVSNLIVGEEHQLDAPTENGSVSIAVLKFSCVKNYEPDVTDEEHPQPNGYPDPAWEPAAP